MLIYQENKQACLTLKNPVDHLDAINLQGFFNFFAEFPMLSKGKASSQCKTTYS